MDQFSSQQDKTEKSNVLCQFVAVFMSTFNIFGFFKSNRRIMGKKKYNLSGPMRGKRIEPICMQLPSLGNLHCKK